MYCPQCGAPLTEGSRFCAECGAPAPSSVTASDGTGTPEFPGQRVRPPIVTVLAVLKLISALVFFVIGSAFIGLSGNAPDRAVAVALAVVFFGGGALALVCAYGLWRLRPFGRYLQLAFSCFGLLGFPLQTIISVLILVYMFNAGVRVLFSGKPVESLTPVERTQLRSLKTGNAATLVIAIVVAVPVGIAIMGILAAIAIPNFLNAIDRGKQKRSLADMRDIGAAVEAYATDHDTYPTATDVLTLRSAVEGRYIKTMPTLDGWGNAFQVSASPMSFTLYSYGKDGVGGTCEPGATETFNEEICFVNGQFTRYPAGLIP